MIMKVQIIALVIGRKKMTQIAFGNLTLANHMADFENHTNNHDMELDYIFQNYGHHLENLTVIEAERRIALENLRSLTKRMQSNRIKQNAESFCKYFSD